MTPARVVAVLIVIAAIADPALTVDREARPPVAVVGDSGFFSRMERELGDDFTLVRGATPIAVATVIGDGAALPASAAAGAPIVAVIDSSAASIDRVSAPPAAPQDARVPIVIRAQPESAPVRLQSQGMTISLGDSTGRHWFTPAREGPALLRAVARQGSDSAVADLVVDVHRRPWSVLFHDLRPSWMSTFVRRSLEADPRFAVGSRIRTSRGITTDVGRTSELGDAVLEELYDAIVVGAPERLGAADVAALERFLRRRGGGVVLLFDEAPSGGAYDRLTGPVQWNSRTVQPTRIAAGDGLTLRAGELSWASAPALSPLAKDSTGRLVVWSVPLGSGTLVVSGARDSWKYRDGSVSGFAAFWQTRIAEVAAGSIPPLTLTIAPAVVRPGEWIDIRVGLRDDSARPDSARLVSASGESAIRLFPDDQGSYVARIRAPRDSGMHRVVVTGDGSTAIGWLAVGEDLRHVRHSRNDLASAAVASGGRASSPERVAADLDAIVKPSSQLEEWHPMRHPAWLPVLVLLLGAEWWSRRRNGMP